jgi:thiol-disulfide isomerase/thioredoxin
MRRRAVVLAGVAASWFPFPPVRAQAADARPVIEWPGIQLLDGGALSASSWQGQAAVVVFWATDCPFCKRHNAHIDKLHRAMRGQPLRVLGVALDTDAKAVRQYMAVNRYEFPVALDGGILRQRLTTRHVIPMTCLIDRQGRLLQAIPGEMFEEDVLDLARILRREPA